MSVPGDAASAQPRVSIVHDYLTQRGGAERVVLELLRQIPDSELVTSFYEPAATYPEFGERPVRVSALNRVRMFRRDPRLAFPVLPLLFAAMRTGPGETVLCSSSGWAHGVRATAPKVVYCHNPARWLYQPGDYFAAFPRSVQRCLSLLLTPLKRWDRRKAASAAVYVANSSAVAARIQAAYGITPLTVFPPASLRDGPRRAVPGLSPGFLLTVGRKRGYKNTEVICAAVARQPSAQLVVVGGLPHRRGGWPDRLTGAVGITDEELRWLYANCCAVVALGHEDFGLSPIEGFGFGKPCLALRAGGYLDSCVEGVTGAFVDAEDVGTVADALAAFDPRRYSPEVIRAHADTFSPECFGEKIREILRSVAHGT